MLPTPVSKLLTFPFKDPEWIKKLFILALVLLVSTAIPILPLILAAGYMARIIQKMVVEKKEPSLPAWDDLGGIFRDGWRPVAVALTFLLPIFALFFFGWLTLSLSNFYAPVEQMWANDRNIDPREFVLIVSSLLGGGGFIIAGIFSMLISFLIPAALVHTVVHQEYAAAFRFKEWWKVLTANLPGFLAVYLITFGINLVAGMVLQVLFFTIILCWTVPVLAFAFSSYSYVVYAALFAEAYRVGEEKRLNHQGQQEGKGGKEKTLNHQEHQGHQEGRKVDTLPLPPPPHVPGVDTIILPPPASVPGVDTIILPPEEQAPNQPQPGENSE